EARGTDDGARRRCWPGARVFCHTGDERHAVRLESHRHDYLRVGAACSNARRGAGGGHSGLARVPRGPSGWTVQRVRWVFSARLATFAKDPYSESMRGLRYSSHSSINRTETHFFSAAVQLVTSVIGSGVSDPDETTRKRPSAATSNMEVGLFFACALKSLCGVPTMGLLKCHAMSVSIKSLVDVRK